MSHLGGHMNKTHVDKGTLDFLFDVLGIKSVLDVGCGPAGMQDLCEAKGLKYQGIDGDTSLAGLKKKIMFHDFTAGKVIIPERYDLGWSVEFLEHVDEKFQDNYMAVFRNCKYVVITHALPGETGGHHHVNLQDGEYWKEVFAKRGFAFDQILTKNVRVRSTMTKGFMQKTGMVFINEKE